VFERIQREREEEHENKNQGTSSWERRLVAFYYYCYVCTVKFYYLNTGSPE